MPEGCEIVLMSQYLLSKLKGKNVSNILPLGNYKLAVPTNFSTKNYYIKNIQTHGKVMWFTLKSRLTDENNPQIYVLSQFGLTGKWIFGPNESKNNKVCIKIKNSDSTKTYDLFYNDPLNFGKVSIYSDKSEIENKISLLAPDALKSDIDDITFRTMVDKFNKSKPHAILYKVLMDQTKKNGLFSGLGNYLVAEILYRAKISPLREIGTLTEKEQLKLLHSIKYTTKLSYYNNPSDYLSNIKQFLKKHKKYLDENKKYPVYHKDIKLKDKVFEFNVYKRKTDKLGNIVKTNKTLVKGRTIYWVDW